jgi:hypothetical protein
LALEKRSALPMLNLKRSEIDFVKIKINSGNAALAGRDDSLHFLNDLGKDRFYFVVT